MSFGFPRTVDGYRDWRYKHKCTLTVDGRKNKRYAENRTQSSSSHSDGSWSMVHHSSKKLLDTKHRSIYQEEHYRKMYECQQKIRLCKSYCFQPK